MRPTPPVRHDLSSRRDLLATFALFGLGATVVLALAYWMLDPAPPHHVVLATGADQGAYAEFGTRYARLLGKDGVRVDLRPSQGADENLRLLRDAGSGVQFAFVQGGSDDRPVPQDPDDSDLVSLGSLFYEPLWLFYREDAAQRLHPGSVPDALTDFTGWRLNVGAPGSGVSRLMATLLAANHLDSLAAASLHEPSGQAVDELLAGRLDALVLNSAPESALVQRLLGSPGIALLDFGQADAYVRRFAFLTTVTLPRGVIDLARNLPARELHLIAPTANLVARRDTHPALIQLFVQAARQVHGGAGWFQRRGEFPNPAMVELPLAKEAQRLYASGTPLLQRYLPFWLANLIERMWPVLVTVAAVLIPLSRLLPPLVDFRIRSRIFRWYGQLRDIDVAMGVRDPAQLRAELDAIEARVTALSVPLSYADELYALRSHIQMVALRLAAARLPGAVAPVGGADS